MITSTARASTVFLSSYRNTIFNQSARVFSEDYFLNTAVPFVEKDTNNDKKHEVKVLHC